MLSPSQNAFIRWAWQGGTFECEGCGGTVSSGETLYIALSLVPRSAAEARPPGMVPSSRTR